MAEDALDTVPGIRDVHNQLRVQQDPSQPQGRATPHARWTEAARAGPARRTPTRAERRSLRRQVPD